MVDQDQNYEVKERSPEIPDDVAAIRAQVASPEWHDRYRHIVDLIISFTARDSLPTKGPIRYLVATGELENRPYDISALSCALCLPRTTIFRHLDEMKEQGTVYTQREGRRTVVYLTHDGWRELKQNGQAFDPLIDKLVLNQIKYLQPDCEHTE